MPNRIQQSGVVLLVICFWAVTPFACSQPKPEKYSLPVGFGNNAFKHIEGLCQIGIRSAGTENETKAADYILNQFRNAGINAHAEPFEFESFELTNVALTIDGKPVDPVLLCLNPYSGQRIYQGTALSLRSDSVLDKTDPKDFEGKTLISNNPSNYFRLLFLKPQLIIYIDSTTLKQLDSARHQSYSLQIAGEIQTRKSANIVAHLGDSAAGATEIIVSSHCDSYKSSPGADDNGSGTGVLIELARYLKTTAIPKNHKITFIAFGAEELALLGSRMYVDKHSQSLQNCVLNINLDQVGGGGDTYIETKGGVEGIPLTKGTNTFPPLYINRAWEGIHTNWRMSEPDLLKPFFASNHPDWLVDIINASVKSLGYTFIQAGNMGSDQQSFAQAGIPATGVLIDGNIVHDPQDTPDHINKESLKKAGDIVLCIVMNTLLSPK